MGKFKLTMERDWESEDAANTLTRAEEIKAKPHLARKAHRILKDKAVAAQMAVINVGQALNHKKATEKKQAQSSRMAEKLYGGRK